MKRKINVIPFVVLPIVLAGCTRFNIHTHTAGEPVRENEVAATCTSDGSYDLVTYCTSDHTEMSREHFTIPALGHNLVHHSGKAATCTEDGYQPYDTCSRCDYSTYQVIYATGHKAKEPVREKVIPATCLEDGSYDEVVYCEIDNVELSRTSKVIPALGHDLIYHEGKEATCTEKGYAPYHTCSRCDYSTYVEIEATGHHADEGVKRNIVEATCTSDGSYDLVSYCKDCGMKMGESRVVVKALGHNLVHHHGKESSCTVHGYSEYDECSRCDYSTKVELPLKEHVVLEHIENIIAPTLEQEGTYDVVSVCKECEEEINRVTKTIGNSEHIHLDANNVEVLIADYYRLNVIEGIDVIWSVSNEEILSINQSGKLVSYGVGESVVFATNVSSGEVASAYIKIIDDEINIAVPEGYHTVEDIFPMIVNKCSRYVEDINWSSSNTDIAEIDLEGNVTAKEVGKCLIRGTLQSGKYDEVELNIVKNEIIIDKTYVEIRRNKTYEIKAVETKPGTLTFSSSNPSIVSVSGNIASSNTSIGSVTITINSSTCGTKTIEIKVVKVVVQYFYEEFSKYFDWRFDYESFYEIGTFTNCYLKFKMRDEVFVETLYVEFDIRIHLMLSGYATQYKEATVKFSLSTRSYETQVSFDNHGVKDAKPEAIWMYHSGYISL